MVTDGRGENAFGRNRLDLRNVVLRSVEVAKHAACSAICMLHRPGSQLAAALDDRLVKEPLLGRHREEQTDLPPATRLARRREGGG
jgi:hypothetical protein